MDATVDTAPRKSWIFYAIITVPVILGLGFLSGQQAGSGNENLWFATLNKPAAQPPGWAFGAAWSLLYVLMGLAVARVMATPPSPERRYALGLFFLQLILNFAWSPLFFGAHLVLPAFLVILAMIAITVPTLVMFARQDGPAGWLLAPYLAWLVFAAYLNWEIFRLNP